MIVLFSYYLTDFESSVYTYRIVFVFILECKRMVFDL